MNDPLGVSPSKGNQGTTIREPHEVKKKSFDLGGNRTHDLRIRSTVTLPTKLRGRTEKVGGDLGGEFSLSCSVLSALAQLNFLIFGRDSRQT